MKSTPLKWVLWLTIIAVLLAVTVATVVSLVLPIYVEKKLIPGLALEFGLTPEQTHVRRIGWWGTDLGPIQFSANRARAVTIAAIQVDYTPLSLLRGQIKGIALGGLGIEISVTSKGIAIGGGQAPKHPATAQKNGTDLDIKTLLPISLGRFSIIQSHLLVNLNHRRHDIPFELKLDTSQLATGHLKGDAVLAIAGNPIDLTVSMDQSANSARIAFDIKDFLLESLSQLVHLPAQLNAAGTSDISGWGSFELRPLRLSGLSISSQFRDTHIASPNGTLKNMAPTPGKSQPIHLIITGDSLAKLQWRCEPFSISSLVHTDVSEFKGVLAYTNENWSLTSTIKSMMPKQKLLDRAELKAELAMGWRVTAHGGSSGNGIEFDLSSQTGGPLIAIMEGRKFSSQNHEIKIDGHFQNNTLHAEGKFAAGEILFQLPEGKMNAPLIKVDGTVTIPLTDANTLSSMTALATMPDVRSKWGTTTVHLPKVTAQASGERKPHQPWQFDTRCHLSNGRIIDPSKGIKATKLSMVLPLKWPDASQAGSGRVDIAAIQWNNRQVGGLKGMLQQTPQGLAMTFRHTSKLFPGLRVIVSGELDTSGAKFNAQVPPYHLADAIDLGRFVPEAAGFRLSGQVRALGQLAVDGAGIRASGGINFIQGRLREEAQGFLLEEIDMEIQMNDLLDMKSAPQQRLRIGNLELGNLKANHLKVDFQIEDQKTLFIEKAGINWSKGKINTSSIRIVTGKEDYDVTLFCDRLNLAMVLEQFGAAQASGEGTVSGRIPIRWTEGKLQFDNGFLFSTPGQPGAIQITGTQKLLSGLPPGTPQHTQLDIATEALKDYTYKWAKLNVRSEGERLLLKLQLDGKPNQLLPFTYDQSLGQFKRVAGEGQADFKGISIDLNFRSPLNDIINYKDLIKQDS